ncbi:MAG TPA: hypothetical protein VFR09_01635 [Alphaproteobacteria bacterium]|nr:hypothetical protein [Alphaproteobacteria bacterium]
MSPAHLRRASIALALVAVFTVAQPRPARAQFDPGVLAELVLTEAHNAAQFIWQHADSLITHMFQSLSTVVNTAGQEAQSEANKLIGQSQTHQSVVNNIAGQAADAAGKYYVAVGSNGTKLTTTCPTSALITAQVQLKDGVDALTHALTANNQSTNVGNGAAAEAAWLADTCKKGLRDTTIPWIKATGGACAQSPAQSGAYVNEDLDSGSVTNLDQYSLPAKTKLVGGTLTLPDATDLTTAEMGFVAAEYYCRGLRIHLPEPPGGNKPVLGMVHSYLEFSMAQAKINKAFHMCNAVVADRTAVSQQAATISTPLQQLYNAQVGSCIQMKTQGMITADELSKCQTNGMSAFSIRKYNAFAYGRPDYIAWRSQSMQQSTETHMRDLNVTGVERANNFANIEQTRLGPFLSAVDALNGIAPAAYSNNLTPAGSGAQ